jgi:hypothetical protein
MTHEKQERALSLRRSGKKLREIGSDLQLSVARTQALVARAARQETEEQWTDGLPPSVANVVRHRGFRSRMELSAAISNGSLQLMAGIGMRRVQIIAAWLAGK